MTDELLNLITSFVKDGLRSLEDRDAGKIIDTGTVESGKAFLYSIADCKYLVSIVPYDDSPSIEVKHVSNDPTGLDSSMLIPVMDTEEVGKHDLR